MAIDASNFEDCLAKIAAKGGRNAWRAREILQQVHDRGSDLEETGAADPYIQAAKELSDRARQDAANSRIDAVRNAKKGAAWLDDIEKNGQVRGADAVIRRRIDTIISQAHGHIDRWQSPLEWALKKSGMWKAAISGGMDREAFRELRAMSSGQPLGGPNGPAREFANALRPVMQSVRARLNAAGARIGDAADYIVSMRHDADKLRAAAGAMRDAPDKAFRAWWDFTQPRLDPKTFDAVTPKEGETTGAARERFGRSVYDALVTGIHKAGAGNIGDADYMPPAFEGTGNIGRKLSEGRVLFWKDAAAQYDYFKKFGQDRTLLEAAMRTLDQSGRNLALMDSLGTNPAGRLNMIVRRVMERYRDDLDGVRKFKSALNGAFLKGKPSYDALMMQLDGSANAPVNSMWARIGRGVRSYEIMTDLGGVGVTHAASLIGTAPTEAFHHGIGRMEAMGRLISELSKGDKGAARQELHAQLGAYGQGLLRGIRSIATPDENYPGMMSRWTTRFMDFTGLPFIAQRATMAARDMYANNLARNLGKDFGRLSPYLRNMLTKYGIGKGEWSLLSGVKDGIIKDESGLSYLTPRDAMNVSRFDAEALLRERGAIAKDVKGDAAKPAIDSFIQGLSDKLYAYYGDAARHSIVTPDMKQRALLIGRTQPGTFAGEMARYASQFKFWPVAAFHQVIERELYQSLSRKSATFNIGMVAGLTALGGYMRMAINDAALGYPVRNPFDMSRDKDKNGEPTGLPHGVATMLAAVAQGGGLGILGDFLFSGINGSSREGAGLFATLAGPVPSDADATVKIFHELMQGKVGWPEIARFGVKHVPFANLVYLKGALDYLVWYHLYEAASPGWWERTNRRLEREQGRTMQGYAPGRPIPYTPFGAGAGR